MQIDALNPPDMKKCPSCDSPLEWGVTTKKVKGKEVCNVCKAVLGKD